MTDNEVNAARAAWRAREGQSMKEVVDSLGMGMKTFSDIIRGKTYEDIKDPAAPLSDHDRIAKAYWKERKTKRIAAIRKRKKQAMKKEAAFNCYLELN